MKKTNILLISFLLISNLLFSQKLNQIDVKTLSNTSPTLVTDETAKRGIPSTVMIWDTELLTKIDGSYVIKMSSTTGFTCFGLGWKSNQNDIAANSFKVQYKIVKNPSVKDEADKKWGIFEQSEGYLKPSDTETDYYWTDLLFGYDEQSRQELLITLTPPENVEISEIRIDFMNLSNDIDPSHAKNMNPVSTSKSCPQLPAIIPREDWCGTYTACTNATYTPTTINATHTVIHHGASPDTYTDGYAVVRSYWNYHVNTLGWADIGYNYLIDKYGNLFQGRKNANAPYSDVRGSHAGDSNSSSLGINFLGNADVTLPTTDQLNKLYAFLGWWYNNKGLSPTSSANILLQSGGTVSKPRICGHKDVNVGGTSCPGNTLYTLLPTIRTNVQNVIDDCSQVDIVAPTTNITNQGWKTTNFTANFTDTDETGGSGLKYKFYQVTDYNGTEWRANKNNGFFNDNFNSTINTDWTSAAGNWAITNGVLLQSDEANSNSNLYTSVNQISGNIYLYNWKMKISGTGTNRRAGLHFFCDDASQSNRNNSYMVYFRADGNTVQIYEYTANTMYLRVEAPCTVTAGTLYDYKVVLNSSTGEINVYQNNKFVGSWTDATPLTVGNQVSLRTGNCQVEYDDFKIFKSRTATASISVGTAITNDIRFQNNTSAASAGKICSIVTDVAKNISTESSVAVNVDFAGPNAVSVVNDGTGSDISVQSNSTSISANWTATNDANNIVIAYYYAIGTTIGGTDILTWTSNGTSLTVTKSGLTLINNITYYVSVKALNSAGLYSNVKTSNGVTVSSSDITSPTTSVANPGWKTTTFTANFTDADNTGGSGLKYRFYQVTDYNGTEWRANKNNGFFNDNFSGVINSDWTNITGNWLVYNGVLQQSDEINSNTNLYSALNQVSGNTYMYNWKMKISGTGTNKRAGLHFFCSDATQSNRGNSYLVYFRADGNIAQIYEYTANVMNLMAEFPCTIIAGLQYDYKIILNSALGDINVFQNNILIGKWTDATPLTVGSHVSLRTGECLAEFDDFRVFKSRTASTTSVTVGNGTAYDVRYQNTNSTTPSGKIVSLVTDIANNISAEASSTLNVDYWGPYAVSSVNDGIGTDIAVQSSLTEISANWTATSDINNTITGYYYAIGTTVGGTNILTWTNVGNALSVTKSGLTLVNGTTYYVSIKALNQAGLYSTVKTSNGVIVNFTIPVTSISVNPLSLSLYVGQTGSLLETVLPDNATNKTVTWNSSSPSVATVNSSGTVTAVSAGTTYITATSTVGGIVSNTCNVTVINIPVPEVIFYESVGNVTATTLITTHETSNGFDNDNFTMSGTGDVRITGASSGYSGASGLANVYLTTAIGKYFQIEGINTTGYTDLNLSFGMYTNLIGYAANVEVSSDGTNYIPLAVSNSTSATWTLKTTTGSIPATSNLRIRFTQTGTSAYIRIDDITLIGTKSMQTVPVTSVSISPSSLNLNVGQTSVLVKTIFPVDATNNSVTWVSSSPSIATVNSAGVVTAVSQGTANITATSIDGGFISNVCTVTVTALTGSVVIFSETVGNVSATTTISNHETANGFDNDQFTMSGTGDIRNTSASGGYTGASGLANVYLTTTIGKHFLIDGINTLGYTNLSLSFGMYTNIIGNAVNVDVSSDGITYNPLLVSVSTSAWSLKTATGTIPATSNLRIRFLQPTTTCQIRIDDIKLVGTILHSGTVNFNNDKSSENKELSNFIDFENDKESILAIYPNPSYEKIYIGINSNLKSAYLQIFDLSGKLIYESENYEFGEPIYISDFSSGIYTVVVNDSGNLLSQKFLKQ